MADAIRGAINTEGKQYYIEQTKKLFPKIKDQFLPQISQWLVDAQALLYMDVEDLAGANKKWAGSKIRLNGQETREKARTQYRARRNIFGYTESMEGYHMRGYVPSDGSSSGEGRHGTANLESQFRSVVIHAERFAEYNRSVIYNADYFKKNDLLRRGYSILTQIGEMIRGDKITYTIILRADSGNFLSETWEYTVNDVDKFLSAATNDARSIFRRNLKINEDKLRAAADSASSGVSRRKWTSEETRLAALYARQVHGYIEWHGKVSKQIFAGANRGQIMEAFMMIGGFTQILPHTSVWHALIKEPMMAATGQTDDGFAAFWQGGEGGYYLATTQLKSNDAGITNMTTLIRQMTRIYSFLNQFKPEQFVEEAMENFNASGKMTEDEVAEKLVEMFYSKEFINKYMTLNFQV